MTAAPSFTMAQDRCHERVRLRMRGQQVVALGGVVDPVVPVHLLAQELKDAFRISGAGWGRTYSGSFPSFRIDYILHDKSMKSFGYTTHKIELSDHYPVSCFISWKRR